MSNKSKNIVHGVDMAKPFEAFDKANPVNEDPELVTYVEFVHGFRMKERGDRMMTALTEDDVDEMRAVPGGVLIQRNGRCYMVWGQNIKFAELKTG